MPTIYGYGRASTDAQKPSLVRQQEGIKAFIESQKAIGKFEDDCRYAGFFEDEDISGSVFWNCRPAGMIINAAIQRDDIIIVSHFDRLFRRVADCSLTVDDFNKRGIRLIIMDVHVDSHSSNGRMILNVLASLKEHERESIIERMMGGWNHRYQLCAVMSAPHGWKVKSRNNYVPCEKTRELSDRVARTCFAHGAVHITEVNRIAQMIPGVTVNTKVSVYQVENILLSVLGYPLMTREDVHKVWGDWALKNLKARILSPRVKFPLRTMPFLKALKAWLAQGYPIDPDPQEITKSRLQELTMVRNMRRVGAPAIL